MTEEKHDIPPWFMPSGDDPVVIGKPRGDAEKENLEEEGELLDENLCPHCGESYEKEEDGRYIHDYRPVEGNGTWQRMGGTEYWSGEIEPAEWCTQAGRQRIEQLPWSYNKVRHGW
ncbi:hypothetical protein [Halorhabdus amylolytica]|uniref:hypothetical protein n=1 Tax=Halorhabdus amylolytica TaxID=2559573 RepID=UPI0010AAEDBE|nr:hypothetical protein [Halorhabdus amylolytica]